MLRRGRKSAAQTPAPAKDRIYGSKTNPKGSASSEKSAKAITLSDKTMKSLQDKLKEFKEKHPAKKNITLNDLKAVYRRGLGAYSSTHRPTITGGVPNTRNAWAMARVNKFLLKAGGTKVKAAYVQDDDLMKYEDGGDLNYYLKITNEEDKSHNGYDGIWIYADFGRNGGITWEIPYSQIEKGNKNNPKYLIVQGISRNKDYDWTEYLGNEDSKGEGTKAIASLFYKYPSLEEIYYDDYSDGFWQKIGGDVDTLKRENFFKYYNNKKYAKGGKLDNGSENFGSPNVDWSEVPFIHETDKVSAEKIINQGFVLKPKKNTNGIYTIPYGFKNEKFDKNKVELIVWLKPNSKILWTDTKYPSDFYVGYGNKFYQNIYKELNPEWESTLKNQGDFLGSSKQGEFCRKLESWLKENGYCGVQQGGEYVITDLSCVDYIEYKDDEYEDGGLIAPNGKSSNLTPEQYELVRTPEFKAWFGDWENDPANASKVVDENGEPLVVYHGTDRKFTTFNKKLIGSSSGEEIKTNGFYFTSDYDTAKYYANYYDEEQNYVMTCFLNLRNPTIKSKEAPSGIFTLIQNAFDNGKDGVFIESVADSGRISDQIIAFEPNQIKLADGTNTTFDANNPDIRFEKGGTAFNDAELLRKYKAGESIGFTAIAHLKAKGLIPRADGTKRKSNKYKEDGGKIENEIKLPDLNLSYDSLKRTLNMQGYEIEPMKQQEVGKLAKGMSVQQIAQHHNTTVENIQQQLDKGTKVEMEHTDNQDIARAIALDHVYESPVYYDKLATIEEEFKDGGVVVGKRHSEYDENGSGEKFLVESTGQVVELEGGEGVLCEESMSSDKKFNFDGKSMTGREIASYLNHKYGGVEFAKGGKVDKKIDKIIADKHVCGCKHQYYHGGELPTAVVKNLKGGEAVVTVKSMESQDKYYFNGRSMTPRQIFSAINMASGGKKFEEGGTIDLKSIRMDTEIQLAKMMYYVTTLKIEILNNQI